MGLAAYGSPTAVDELARIRQLREGGGYRLDTSSVPSRGDPGLAPDGVRWPAASTAPGWNGCWARLAPARIPSRQGTRTSPAPSRRCSNARSLHVLHDLWRRTRSPRLCVAGGCFMNSVLNGKLLERDAVRGVVRTARRRRCRHRAGGGFLGRWRRARHDGACVPRHGPRAARDRPRSRGAPRVGGSAASFTSPPDGDLARLTAKLLADSYGHRLVSRPYRGRRPSAGCAQHPGRSAASRDPGSAELEREGQGVVQAVRRIGVGVRARRVLRERGSRPLHGSGPRGPSGEARRHSCGDPRRRVEPPAHRHRWPKHHLPRGDPSVPGADGHPDRAQHDFNRDEPIIESPQQALECFMRGGLDALVLEHTLVRRRTAP